MSLPGNTPLVINIRPMAEDDHRFVHTTWLEATKKAPGMHRLRWNDYRARVEPTIVAMLARDDVKLMGAYNDNDRILGWIAYSPGKSIHTLHFAYTRFALEGVELRRHGIMTALLDAGQLGKRFIYTSQGEVRLGGTRSRKFRERPLDEDLVEWARKRGVTAVYEPLKEWLQ